MLYTESDVVEYITDNDVKFIRLSFCDVFGVQKNLSIMPVELEHAFRTGVPVDASAVRGFGDEESGDVLLFPDPSTLSLLPWRPSHGRVVRFFCDVKYRDGSPLELDGRYLLKKAMRAMREAGVSCRFSAGCEFYLFQADDNGNSTGIPFDRAGYMGIAPEDKGENVRRDICLTLEEMGIVPLRSLHKHGPGQNEIQFQDNNALRSADDVTTLKFVVRTAAARSGLYATFSPKPIRDQNGSSFLIRLSPIGGTGDSCADAFLAGILEHIEEITAFCNPSVASYERLGGFKTLRYVTWTHNSRQQLMRKTIDADGTQWIELRSPDSTANPYLVYTLLLYAGLDGVKRGLSAPEAFDQGLLSLDREQLKALRQLPEHFEDAIALALDSPFIREHLPERLLCAYVERQTDSQR